MSRIGRTSIPLPEGVSVDISGQKVTVAGDVDGEPVGAIVTLVEQGAGV